MEEREVRGTAAWQPLCSCNRSAVNPSSSGWGGPSAAEPRIPGEQRMLGSKKLDKTCVAFPEHPNQGRNSPSDTQTLSSSKDPPPSPPPCKMHRNEQREALQFETFPVQIRCIPRAGPDSPSARCQMLLSGSGRKAEPEAPGCTAGAGRLLVPRCAGESFGQQENDEIIERITERKSRTPPPCSSLVVLIRFPVDSAQFPTAPLQFPTDSI